jgi:3-oxoacyl-[acyl-carrier protein] reductase
MRRNVLITGGNKGIGLSATEKFLHAGYRVYVLARDFTGFPLKEHQQVEMIAYDLSNIAGVPALVAELPQIDILLNNAGVMFAIPYQDYSHEKIEQILKINLEAPAALITELSKAMIANNYGRIVNNASIAGQIGHPDIWYGITKAGLINMTKSFAKLLGPHGVVVNAVAPGPVATDMLATIPGSRKKAVREVVYTGRFAEPEEVAETMFWLATDCPEYINGTCVDINNGAFPR